METLADVAEELSKRYGAVKKFLKKGEKSDAFISILKKLFYDYGEDFGFEINELPEFKSEVIHAKNNLRKRIKRFDRRVKPNEGSGAEFTLWQVEAYGLNPESY